MSQDQAEARLIERIRGGERELFYELVRPHERAVYLVAYSVLKNEADAEDVAQEAMLKAFRSLSAFRGDARFQHWLVKIAFNEARMRYRKRQGEKLQSLDDSGDDQDYVPLQIADWRELPPEVLERKEIREEIQNAIARLSDKYREVLVLRDIEELSIAETAQILDITEATVKVRLFRARLKLRDQLVERLPGYLRPKKKTQAW
ncbi:MAG TPA: sigma-70 family RNA polymerase sigma factor [Terriglobales bacterium]|nr:sigma-70 family RNA polymerase sigma factor [Terriglobales bacterium]